MSLHIRSDGVDGWVKRIARAFPPEPRYLIPVLQRIQAEQTYLPPEALRAAARYLRVPEAKVYGVATFFAQFRFDRPGKHRVTVCRGTACHVRGSARLVEEATRLLGVLPGCTTSDLAVSLETVSCYGACALAPVVVADGQVHSRQTTLSFGKLVTGLRRKGHASSKQRKKTAKTAKGAAGR